MNQRFPPRFGLIYNIFRNPLTLLGGVLLCLSPITLPAQSVTFVGGQTTVSSSSVASIAVDSSGNLFGLQGNNVVKISKTATGYGAPVILLSDSNGPYLLAVDNEDDVFTIDNINNFLELPWNGSGYGPQISLPYGFIAPGGLAVDTAGDLFVTDNNAPSYVYSAGSLYEFPRSATGYVSSISLPFGGAYNSLGGLALDSAGDIYITDTIYEYGMGDSWWPYSYAFELPKTGSYEQAIQLPVSSFDAVDSAGNLYVNLYSGVAEIPNTGAGYGPETALPIGGFCGQLAIDNAGNIFFPTCDGSVVEFQRQSVNFGSVNFCSSGAPAPCSETV